MIIQKVFDNYYIGRLRDNKRIYFGETQMEVIIKLLNDIYAVDIQ